MQCALAFVLFVLTLGASGGMLAPAQCSQRAAQVATELRRRCLCSKRPPRTTSRTGPYDPPRRRRPPFPRSSPICRACRAPVARTRERILAAARSGELQQLAALMNETMPIFSFTDEKDPIAFWKATYPDSDGVEALSILTTILETGFVHVDEGTPHEMYVWPYFVRMSLPALTPPAEGRAVPDRHRRRLQGHAGVRRVCLLPPRDRAWTAPGNSSSPATDALKGRR